LHCAKLSFGATKAKNQSPKKAMPKALPKIKIAFFAALEDSQKYPKKLLRNLLGTPRIACVARMTDKNKKIANIFRYF
jgi:hypothetical protein